MRASSGYDKGRIASTFHHKDTTVTRFVKSCRGSNVETAVPGIKEPADFSVGGLLIVSRQRRRLGAGINRFWSIEEQMVDQLVEVHRVWRAAIVEIGAGGGAVRILNVRRVEEENIDE